MSEHTAMWNDVISQEHQEFFNRSVAIAEQPAWFKKLMKVPYIERLIEVDGADLHTLHWNYQSDKPKVMLVHGNGAHAFWFCWVAAQLADKYEVIAVTFSGMGDSQWRDIYTKEVFMRDLTGVIEKLGWQQVNIVAHSFGAMIANVAVAQMPELFKSLVICDHFVMPAEHSREWFANKPPSRPTRVYASEKDIRSRFRLLPQQPCVNQYILDFIVGHSIRQVEGGWTWKFDPAIYDHLIVGKKQLDYLLSISCPKSLIYGCWTREHEYSKHRLFSEYYPQELYIHELAESGHHVMLDQPISLTKVIRDRLDAVNE